MDRDKSGVEDLEFLFIEVERFLRDGPEILKSGSGDKNDFLCNLTDQKSGRIYVWGVEAERRCIRIVKEWILPHPSIDGKVDFEKARDAFKYQLSIMLFGPKIPELDVSVFQSLCGRVVSYLERSLKRIVHFVPCNLVADNEMKPFRVGPVRFFPMAEWILENAKEIEEVKGPWESAGIGDHLKSFLWMAKVSVSPCSVDISRERAHTAVNGAINILRLFLPLDYARKFRTTRTWKDHRELDGIWFIDDQINWHSSVQYAPMAEDWNEFISNQPIDLQVASSALNAYVSEPKISTIRDRFLDGLYWIGDACDDWRDSAILVKLAASLERFTKGPSKVEDIQSLVSRRGGFLICRYFRKDEEEYRERIRRIYDARSRLMHGDSKSRSNLSVSSYQAFETTCLVARSAALFFAELDQRNLRERDLDEMFVDFMGGG